MIFGIFWAGPKATQVGFLVPEGTWLVTVVLWCACMNAWNYRTLQRRLWTLSWGSRSEILSDLDRGNFSRLWQVLRLSLLSWEERPFGHSWGICFQWFGQRQSAGGWGYSGSGSANPVVAPFKKKKILSRDIQLSCPPLWPVSLDLLFALHCAGDTANLCKIKYWCAVVKELD